MFFYTIVYCDKPVIAAELNTLRSFASMFLWKDLLHLHLLIEYI